MSEKLSLDDLEDISIGLLGTIANILMVILIVFFFSILIYNFNLFISKGLSSPLNLKSPFLASDSTADSNHILLYLLLFCINLHFS